jgi:hypothetical protein
MMPKHMQELLNAGYELATYRKAQEWFRKRGVSVGYSPLRRSWFFMAVGRPDGPTTVIAWVSLEAFIDMLDAPAATLIDMAAQGAQVN